MTKSYSPGVMIYGGPSVIEYPTNPPATNPPVENYPTIPGYPSITIEKLNDLVNEFNRANRSKGLVSDTNSANRVRISARTEDDGTLKLKIHVNNKFHSELLSEDGNTITVELEVGGEG